MMLTEKRNNPNDRFEYAVECRRKYCYHAVGGYMVISVSLL